MQRKNSGGYIIYGRSDATLNPSFKTWHFRKDIQIVKNFKEINEYIVVGQS